MVIQTGFNPFSGSEGANRQARRILAAKRPGGASGLVSLKGQRMGLRAAAKRMGLGRIVAGIAAYLGGSVSGLRYLMAQAMVAIRGSSDFARTRVVKSGALTTEAQDVTLTTGTTSQTFTCHTSDNGRWHRAVYISIDGLGANDVAGGCYVTFTGFGASEESTRHPLKSDGCLVFFPGGPVALTNGTHSWTVNAPSAATGNAVQVWCELGRGRAMPDDDDDDDDGVDSETNQLLTGGTGEVLAPALSL